LFAPTQTVDIVVIPLRCATGQEEAKRNSFSLVLEREVELEDQQQILDKEAINHYLL